MKLISTLHNHSTLSDGKSAPEEMIEAAIAAGMTDFGFSDHGWTPHDLSYCIPDMEAYRKTVADLKKRYADRIRIWCGVEQDFRQPVRREDFDYVIGSVHYYPVEGIHEVDGSPEQNIETLRTVYGGDVFRMTRDYFDQMVQSTLQTRPDVIGHFDLLLKNNEKLHLFPEDDPRWRSIAMEALEECLRADAVFEVNTGALARNYRSIPYPDEFLLRRLQEKKARVMLNSDCHRADQLCCGLREAAELLKAVGFSAVWIWENGQFIETEL